MYFSLSSQTDLALNTELNKIRQNRIPPSEEMQFWQNAQDFLKFGEKSLRKRGISPESALLYSSRINATLRKETSFPSAQLDGLTTTKSKLTGSSKVK